MYGSENTFVKQVVVLAGKPWAPDGDLDRQQEATERINHSIIGVKSLTSVSAFEARFTWLHDQYDISMSNVQLVRHCPYIRNHG